MYRILTYTVLIVCAGLIFAAVWNCVRYASLQAAFAAAAIPLLASPVVMGLLRKFAEHELPKGMFSWRTQSWAFLFGDSLALPLALGAGVYAWRYISPLGYFRGWDWLYISLVAGFGFAALMLFVLDGPNYSKSGHAERLVSPTKLWHDFVLYPGLGASVVFVVVPAASTLGEFNWAGLLSVCGFVLWLGFGLKDAIWPPRPENLHPEVGNTILARVFT